MSTHPSYTVTETANGYNTSTGQSVNETQQNTFDQTTMMLSFGLGIGYQF
jgi:hypothetical protein